ncbi:type II restriction endonuclease subunit M [Streptomyces sp. MUM 178J]|uniref:type II restriction endonuclease subunit M n=1 Tax=Streptomyces sp. MUM 178J TaxID=2791991 RepID=UPI001F0491E9|nr:type II restriction endonuclease subunit M [Streptomyces sp. MUM 178J]WRQ78643.1 type II restriction endonuclease subunit M [Streptomyces sp. MUM 178J]
MAFEAITNRGEYISAHYLAELFAKDLTELRKRWTSADRAGAPSSRSGVKGLRREYFKAKVRITENKAFDGPEVRQLNDRLLTALAYVEPEGEGGDAEAAAPETAGSTHTRLRRGDFGVMQGDKERSVPVALAVTGPGGLELVALDVTWQVNGELVVADVEDGGAQLLDPIQLDGKQLITGAADAVTFLFGCEDGYAPRYVLLLAGGAVLLADRTAWHEGRFLAVSVDEALDRNLSADGQELEAVAALFGAESLLTEGGVAGYLDGLVDKGRKHAVGVSKELREGLRQSVELIAQEILDRLDDGGADPAELGDPADLASRLTRESLRYLYRILFLLYAEARPELGILPSKDDAYQDGYGLARLGELVSYDLPEEAQDGTHFADSLDLLFRLVDQGHRPLGRDEAPSEDNVTVLDSDGLRFEALRSDLFKADATPLIGSVSVEGERIETKLRNKVLWRVLNLLMLTQGRRTGRGKAGGGTGKGFISYAQLGINQLGAVYEGLMSYTGFFAWDDLYEVAKPDSDGLSGTWVVPLKDADNYDEDVFVKRTDELTGAKKRVLHKKGSFVYRLSGRERQRSASYYTPEVLTRSTVKHALAELLDQDGVTTPARAILDLTVCEPALGSGAFLNEAINQLAAEYLKRRMAELGGKQLPPDRYEAELQKVKAYLALHNCYGVDLNQTAVELAEVSLWLNSMHEGLKAPWFGLHLRRGNSLIGARRAVYAAEALKRKAWLTTVPTDRPLRAGAEDGQFQAGKEIHHFLLPAKGWGAVADAKQAKELAKDERDALAKWRTAVTATPSAAQGKRLLALATRVERLWELAWRRLIVSEREVRRQIDVWGVDPDQPLEKASGDVTREQIESALNEPGSPRGRLKLVMDAWCALWFWPVGQPDTPTPPSMEEWLAFCEAVLGVPPAKAKASSRRGGAAGLDDELGLFADTGEFEKLAADDEFDRVMSQCVDLPSVMVQFPWLSEVDASSRREGFFHWELEFAHIFERGGFDLQMGNPPWHQPKWGDPLALAEYDPWFILENPTLDVLARRRANLLKEESIRVKYFADLSSWAGMNAHLGSPVEHPILIGYQNNLYLNFIERVWSSANLRGIAGMIHPDTHFKNPKGGSLRAAAYRRMRRHFQFRNELELFEIGHTRDYGVHVYGSPRQVNFVNMSGLFHPSTAEKSLTHDGSGEVPGRQFESGGWDLRAHSKRTVHVTVDMLRSWADLVDNSDSPALHARMLRPLTTDEDGAIHKLSRFPERLGGNFWWTASVREDGPVLRRTHVPQSWSEVILQGPHISVANPYAKQPNENCRSKGDYSPWALEDLPESIIPRTNYVRDCERDVFESHAGIWEGSSSTSWFRLAWRRMVDPATERTLNAAILPPGPTHTDGTCTLALPSERDTIVTAGLWASLPLDYFVKVVGKTNLSDDLVSLFPAPLSHPLSAPLLLRTLRLNCLTREYSPLWERLFDRIWLRDRWTSSEAHGLRIQDIDPAWSMATPLRTEFDRRRALVEIDAISAVMLGLTAEQLCAMYRSQFDTLRMYEWETFFASDGHKVADTTHAYNVGIRQTPEETAFVKAWAKAARAGDPTPAIPEGWVKPNREAEMTRAHADFTARLHAGEYGDYAAYLAEHPLTMPEPAEPPTATSTPAPESR